MTTLWTRRQYLRAQIMLHGTPLLMADEAISSVAIEHPEWDMDETRTWNEWVADDDRLRRRR